MDFSIPEELRMLLESLKKFITGELLPMEAAALKAEDGTIDDIPIEFRQRVRRRAVELGFYGIHMPTEAGGGGLSALGNCLFKEEIARLGPLTGSEIHGGFGGPTPILLDCTPVQRDKYLDPVMTAQKTLCFALTEPGAGSDATAIQTTAVKKNGRFVINGRKHFITNGPYADFAVVFAVTDREKRAKGGITAFLIDKGTPGFSVGRVQRTMADSMNQSELVFEDCAVGPEAILGKEGWGFAGAMKWISQGRLSIAANNVGLTERLLTMSVEYAKQRVQFGKPIGENQAIQWMLADMATELEAARWMVYHTACMADQGGDIRTQASMAKLFCSEMVGRAADAALQVHGGMGYMKEFPIEGIYRKVRAARIGEGTSEIQRMTIARSLLKGP